MKHNIPHFAVAALVALAGMPAAHALTRYDVVTTFYEPQTHPKDSIFKGSFDYDAATHTVTNLQGVLSESMTGMNPAGMVWLSLDHPLASWYDATLGGTFAAAFKNTTTTTFFGGGWTAQDGVDSGSLYAGYPTKANNPGNAYALIFVPDSPTAALSQAQIDHLAYADCTPTAAGGMMAGGGMMGAVCMTGVAQSVYGTAGTMDGYPLSQTISAAVPEPTAYALMLAGLGVLGALGRRRARQG